MNRATGSQLVVPLQASTMVAQHSCREGRSLRLDNPGGARDNGLALSCVYVVAHAPSLECRFQIVDRNGCHQTVTVRGDEVFVYDSRAVKTAIQFQGADNVFTVAFFAHGVSGVTTVGE